MSSTVSWVNISPGFTGKELQELQGLRLRVGWGNLNAGDPEAYQWQNPVGRRKAPALSLRLLKKAAMSSNHCFFWGDVFNFGEGYSNIKRCDLRFSTSMPAKFHLFWEVSLRDLVFERWFTSTWVSKKNGWKVFPSVTIDSTPRKKIFIMIHFKFQKEKNCSPKIFCQTSFQALASTAEYLYVNDVPWPCFLRRLGLWFQGVFTAGFSLLRRLPFWFFWQIETQTSLFWKEIHFLRFWYLLCFVMLNFRGVNPNSFSRARKHTDWLRECHLPLHELVTGNPPILRVLPLRLRSETSKKQTKRSY